MAHTKAQRAVKGNRDSISKRLGVKLFGGQKANPGNVIIRQRGSKVNAGHGVLLSKDFTLIAQKEGVVTFYQRLGKKYVKIV
ncbi:50S ribosomal protein L27 [Candidatus Roizmanbacteria bacterium RIFCSPLOWO2_01_FULL_38_12]|uniref:Large ribosomal subunit protein bL27 n=1 Tax=Candidatus Roizmanbacteria bacterium RIFCSPLOWO2_01_FULL_38_12 TaxID=1802061 RepID=A0A1F7J0M8_9BACT|nr:MAG: 50S ribosomal protein L27 [Candidatus Roizmanbacteria bacterium RIFCSPHIGHO2_01_FULL_38_15]OGK36193.1 MAG: 50S ribosomal protein L27 [Candidatus Roizmanbacteria bacterium RIFCSPHIGHO2_12_FULL_38_13]OGK49176.1 MAG: 50S ribosomal protein L27 [Candidatus Roizmanbacteria bacterium RIFCSPLOWO2_01_FULL_38_12]